MRADTWNEAPARPAPGGIRRLCVARRRWSALALAAAVVLGIGVALRPAAPAESAPLAPDFTLPVASAPGFHVAGGGMLSLHALRGHAVLLNFFNSKCPDCLDELRTLQRTARAYQARGVIVLGVATGGDTVTTARQLAVAAHLPYPVVVDERQDVAWRYGVSGWPTSFFLDARGRARGQYISTLDERTVRAGLAQAGALPACGNSGAQCGHVDAPTLVAAAVAPAPSDALSIDTPLTPARAAPHFAVRDQSGLLVTPTSLRGKVVALTFISALCREQCPLIGQTLSQVHRELGRDAAHFAIVAISVDPELDTPLATWAFAAESGWKGASWHYLTAPRNVLARVWAAYWIYVAPPSPIFKQTGNVVHDAHVFLIDPRGRLRGFYDVPVLAPRVAATVRALIGGQ